MLQITLKATMNNVLTAAHHPAGPTRSGQVRGGGGRRPTVWHWLSLASVSFRMWLNLVYSVLCSSNLVTVCS